MSRKKKTFTRKAWEHTAQRRRMRLNYERRLALRTLRESAGFLFFVQHRMLDIFLFIPLFWLLE
jgi:hypothetical protein